MKPNSQEILTGLRYWNGELSNSSIEGDFRLSRKSDVFDLFADLNEKKALEYEKTALRSLRKGEGVFSMLVAGASSRMNPALAPPEVRKMVRGRTILSKAAVPLGAADGKVVTYLDEFGFNLSRFLKAAGKGAERNAILLFSNERYFPEHQKILKEARFFGFKKSAVRFFLQPLGAKYWATPADVLKLRGKRSEAELRRFQKHSEKIGALIGCGRHSAVVVPGEREPLGHGEYFHQLVESGELLRILDEKRKWIFIKNVDNCAAKVDRVWLRILGRFIQEKIDFQPEVSPRFPGQTGGCLIVMGKNGAHQIVEDPNLRQTNAERGLNLEPSQSYWLNNAVALFTPRYAIDLYRKPGQSDSEFLRELRGANAAQRKAIAERGRGRFPCIFDVKPSKSGIGATVKRETNLWQSTGLVSPDLKVSAVGVRSARNISMRDYQKMSPEKKKETLASLRFLSTKQWTLPPETVEAARKKMKKELGPSFSEADLWLTFETYKGNRLLSDDLLAYGRSVDPVPNSLK